MIKKHFDINIHKKTKYKYQANIKNQLKTDD